MSKRSPRLLFTQEERTAPELKKAIRKADKRMKKLEKAEAKIPKKTVKKKQRVVDPKTGTVTTRLSFEEVDKKRPPSKLTHALRDAPGAAALSAVHREIREYEQDNVGVESAHGMEQAAERAVRLAQHAHRSHKEKPYAEIKALCAGDERIREKMDLDVDVARLRLMKANHQSQQYRLEDNILRHFPAQIEESKGFLSGFEADMKTLEQHPHPKDGFAGMEVKGDLLTDKDNAGAALLEAFKDAKGLEPVPIGSYRGFAMSLTVENFGKDFVLTLKGRMSHRVELGKDARGNLVRIDNALAQMPERYKTVQGRLENVQAQLATAKAELGKPFPQEAELKEKSARLAELNAELNIDDRTPLEQAAENVVAKRPSVLGKLKAPCVHGAGEKKKSHEQEAR